MEIVDQINPASTPLAGIAHATWAGAQDGLSQLSIWRQTLAPGAATPPHSHDCDEIVLCLAGTGEVHEGGQSRRFGAEQTVILPKGGQHQIFNAGQKPLEILGIFGATPVVTRLPDGASIDLPWRT
jgi:quercetin dioxygenase-like cupin family protein